MITPADRQSQLPVAVNQTFAKQFFPGQDPFGASHCMVGNSWISIVGIVKDFRRGGETAQRTPPVFVPPTRGRLVYRGLPDFAVRAAGDLRTWFTRFRNRFRR
jgi:hypothetical protein